GGGGRRTAIACRWKGWASAPAAPPPAAPGSGVTVTSSTVIRVPPHPRPLPTDRTAFGLWRGEGGRPAAPTWYTVEGAYEVTPRLSYPWVPPHPRPLPTDRTAFGLWRGEGGGPRAPPRDTARGRAEAPPQ